MKADCIHIGLFSHTHTKKKRKKKRTKMALNPSPDYQTSFESIGLLVQKELNIDFQDGGHLGSVL